MSKEKVYVGIDLHKRSFSFVMLSVSGEKLAEGKRATSLEAVCDFASRLDHRHEVTLEPLEDCYWFMDQLRPYVASLHLANSGKVRLIAESRLKNDRVDARILADLLRVGYLPEVYIPNYTLREWRCLVSHRIRLVRDRTRIKNRILGLLNRAGHRIAAADPFGKKGRQQLDGLELPPSLRAMVDDHLTHLDLLTAQIARQEGKIAQIAGGDAIVQMLTTIDGIGEFTGVAIRAIVGEMARFRSVKAFGAYTGLIPGYRCSADTVRNGPITKQGNSTLRWLLIQAVPHAIRHSDYLKRLYYRVCLRSSVGKAKVAVAHALARIIYHVWTEARPYYR
ncbi:MAG TPA: IS110 family transposase [Gammaproteobacteria bacterium]|nr:IS110 family transposase [Gammaproteobacteria bacterium]